VLTWRAEGTHVTNQRGKSTRIHRKTESDRAAREVSGEIGGVEGRGGTESRKAGEEDDGLM
jgi:hypothetical protein